MSREELQKEFIKKVTECMSADGFDTATMWTWFSSKLETARKEERELIRSKIGFLRQWINERPNSKDLVSNFDIEEFLFTNHLASIK